MGQCTLYPEVCKARTQYRKDKMKHAEQRHSAARKSYAALVKNHYKQQKDQTRLDKDNAIHDDKITNSAAMFKNTKVTSCSKILQKNGQAVCLAFTNGAPKPVDLNSKRLSEVTALSQD